MYIYIYIYMALANKMQHGSCDYRLFEFLLSWARFGPQAWPEEAIMAPAELGPGLNTSWHHPGYHTIQDTGSTVRRDIGLLMVAIERSHQSLSKVLTVAPAAQADQLTIAGCRLSAAHSSKGPGSL